LSPKIQRYLESRLWPGNVRELSHLLEAALILSEGGMVEVETVQAAEAMALQGDDAESLNAVPGTEGPSCVPSSSSDLDTSGTSSGRGVPSRSPGAPCGERYAFMGSAEEERELIRLALVRARGNKTRAAKDLGMARNTLRHKLRRYGLG
jgi:DNA-binding NtrC family response regulator